MKIDFDDWLEESYTLEEEYSNEWLSYVNLLLIRVPKLLKLSLDQNIKKYFINN